MNSRSPGLAVSVIAMLINSVMMARVWAQESDAAAAAAHADRSTLSAGQWVLVDAADSDDGLVARRVVLRDGSRTVRVDGPVSDIEPLTVAGVVVDMTSHSALHDPDGTVASVSELRRGTRVEAVGRWQRDHLMARRIRVRRANEIGGIRFSGELESVDGSAIVVLGRRVRLRDDLVVVDERAASAGRPAVDRLRRDPDDRAATGIRIGDALLVGGRVVATLDGLSNPALDADGADRRDRVASGVQLQASWRPRERLEAYAKVAAEQDLVTPAPAGAWGASLDARVYELYLLARRIGGSPVDLQIGRQRLRDAREWFFDEYVDGARVRMNGSSWHLDAVLSRSLFAGPERDRARHDKQHLVVTASRRIVRGARLSTFLIARDDHSARDDDPTWIGASLVESGAAPLRYWSTAAIRRGHSGETRLRGWAIDAGVSRRMRWRLAPTFTLGYALASGDRTPGDGVDSTFRQTGLEDNEGRMGGTRFFNYYGTLFEPELSNLRITTAAVNVRPHRHVSLDAIYHAYSQMRPRATVAPNALNARASGRAGRLGDEWDLVIAVPWRANIDLSLSAGIFLPGRALGEHRGTAVKWRPQIRIYY